MSTSGIPRPLWRTLLPALVLALLPGLAQAQSGSVRGSVTGPEGEPVAAAQVGITGSRLSTSTDNAGAFTLRGVPAGTHRLRVTQLGFGDATREVTVRAGEETVVSVQLQTRALELDALVLSASRRMERQSEAPATITRVGADVLDNTAGGNFVGALKQATGLDFVQVGVTSVAINARGFNSSFNNRMLMLEDGRIAVLPENGLPVGAFTPIPKVDLEGIEVVVGPGSALYGADASNGVLTLRSKDPRDHPGTTIEVTGGSREYMGVQGRQAGVLGNIGYKVLRRIRAVRGLVQPHPRDGCAHQSVGAIGGRYQRAGLEQPGDPHLRRPLLLRRRRAVRPHRRLEPDRRRGADERGPQPARRMDLQRPAGPRHAARMVLQRVPHPVQRRRQLRGQPLHPNRIAQPATVSDDSVRMLSDWPSNGVLYAAEVQNTFRIPQLLGTAVTWGGQFRHDVVSSDRQWLTDRLTGKDLTISQYGGYAQTETPLLPQLRMLLAGRVDNHENYDAQFSPKAGLLFSPAEGHTIRGFYNRAFKSPSTLQTNFWIPDFVPAVGVFGNRDGFTVRNAAGAVVRTYTPMVPERNETWELGYKGLIGGRLFMDLTGYYSQYENFMSPLTTIANPYAGAAATTAFGANDQPMTNEAGAPQIVLTYFNLGEATIYGMDASLTYMASPRVSFTGTASLLEVDEIRGINTEVAGEREATAINSPTTKWSLGTSLRDFGPLLGGATLRYVNGYRFTSGINAGRIPTFSTLDLNVGYRLPMAGTQLNVSASNLFTCRSPNPAIEGDERKCGFGVKHTEMVNMPEIGTMVFVGLRFHTR
jgi:outer membrane receptor for ferrienterochelin and colicins